MHLGMSKLVLSFLSLFHNWYMTFAKLKLERVAAKLSNTTAGKHVNVKKSKLFSSVEHLTAAEF
jgi:hypothetical protein